MVKLNGTGPACLEGRSKCLPQLATSQEQDQPSVEIVFFPFVAADGEEAASSLNSTFAEKDAIYSFLEIVRELLFDNQELLESIQKTNFTSIYASTVPSRPPDAPPQMDDISTPPPNNASSNQSDMFAIILGWSLAFSLARMVWE